MLNVHFFLSERAFQISWKKKAPVPQGGLSDYGILKAWGGGVERFGIPRVRGGLSILEFPKARGGLDEDAARGKVWIFSGITHSLIILKLQTVTVTQFEWAPRSRGVNSLGSV